MKQILILLILIKIKQMIDKINVFPLFYSKLKDKRNHFSKISLF